MCMYACVYVRISACGCAQGNMYQKLRLLARKYVYVCMCICKNIVRKEVQLAHVLNVAPIAIRVHACMHVCMYVCIVGVRIDIQL